MLNEFILTVGFVIMVMGKCVNIQWLSCQKLPSAHINMQIKDLSHTNTTEIVEMQNKLFHIHTLYISSAQSHVLKSVTPQSAVLPLCYSLDLHREIEELRSKLLKSQNHVGQMEREFIQSRDYSESEMGKLQDELVKLRDRYDRYIHCIITPSLVK